MSYPPPHNPPMNLKINARKLKNNDPPARSSSACAVRHFSISDVLFGAPRSVRGALHVHALRGRAPEALVGVEAREMQISEQPRRFELPAQIAAVVHR